MLSADPGVRYPRVLHVGGQPVGTSSNTGVTMATVFGAWPEASFMQICLEDAQSSALRDSLHVAPEWSAPIEALLRSVINSKVRRRLRARPVARETDGMNNSVARVGTMSVRARARLSLQAVNDIGPVWLAPSTVQAVREFRPEVIHSALGGVRVMRLVLALSKRFSLPIVPHFMDDWPATLFADGRLGGLARAEAVRTLRHVLERAPSCLTIGDDMREEFSRRYGRDCVTVGNSVDLQNLTSPLPGRTRHRTRLVLRYVGGLHLGRDGVLGSLAEGIMTYADEGRQWTIELFVPDADRGRAVRLAERYECITCMGSLSPDQVLDALSAADALLFLESDAREVLDFTRLSVSTKVPQYLAARRPVLAVGPSNQGSIRVLRRAPATVFAGQRPRASELRGHLSELRHRVDAPAEELDFPAWFVEGFSQSATQERLRTALLEASATPGGLERYPSRRRRSQLDAESLS